MAQPIGLSPRPAMVKISCTLPSGLPSACLMKRASRTGPLEVMKEGTVFQGAIVAARASWGLTAGLVPPRAGWMWQPPQESRLNRGPSPSATASTCENCGTPWLLKKSSSPAVRPPIGAPAPGAPPRGPGSDCAKQHVAVNRAARHVHWRVTLKNFRTFIDTPPQFLRRVFARAEVGVDGIEFYSCCDRRLDWFPVV